MQTISSILTSKKSERQNTNSMDKDENSMIFKCILLIYCFFLVYLFVSLYVYLARAYRGERKYLQADFKQLERGIKN